MLSDKAKKLLADLDECLYDEKLTTASNLWAVLTALRGPDHLDSLNVSDDLRYEVKPSTTAVIRYKVFPRASNAGVTGVTREDTDRLVDIRKQLGGSGHFLRHVHDAFNALDLKWDDWNK